MVIEEAEYRLTRLDTWDKEAGLSIPSEQGIQSLLSCIDASLSSGIQLLLEGDKENAEYCLADAYVMLKQAEDLASEEL